jgi:hypothetical protein
MENLKKEYRDLEMRVFANLRYLISKSEVYSKHYPEKCIKIDIGNYKELANIDNTLQLLDENGYQYSLAASYVDLEQLIDIIIEKNGTQD